MFKAGDLVVVTEDFKRSISGCDQRLLDVWLKPKFLVVENVCKASEWCMGIMKTQLSVNVYYGHSGMTYLSISEKNFARDLTKYKPEFTYELVEEFCA
jgi:hypothetical protein